MSEPTAHIQITDTVGFTVETDNDAGRYLTVYVDDKPWTATWLGSADDAALEALRSVASLADESWADDGGFERYARIGRWVATIATMAEAEAVECNDETAARVLFASWVNAAQENISQFEADRDAGLV